MGKKFDVGVRITGDSKGAEAAAKRTEGAMKRLGNVMKKNLLVSTAAIALGVRSLARAFGSLVTAANQQEDAIRALDAALGPLGDKAGEVSKRLQEQAAALQKITTAGDETIIKGQALIATFTQDEEQIKKSTEAALNLSAAVGVDLNAAFLLMGKAASGETSTLSRYGIILDEGIPKTEKFAAVLGLIEEKMGGRAQAAADTFSGRMKQLGSALGDLKENLGFAITENERLSESIKDTTKRVQENQAALRQTAEFMGGAFTSILGGTADKFYTVGEVIGATANKFNELIGAYGSVEASQSAVEATAKRLGITVEEVRQRMAASVSTIGEVNAAEASLVQTEKEHVETLGQLGRVQKELTDTAKTFTDELERLGIVLDQDVETEIAQNNQALELIERRFQLGEISAHDFARAQLQVAQANRELRQSLSSASEGVERVSTAAVDAADSMEGFRGSVRGASQDLRTLRRDAVAADGVLGPFRGDFANQAWQRRNRVSGGLSPGMSRSSFPVTIGGGTFTYQTTLPNVRTLPNGRLVLG